MGEDHDDLASLYAILHQVVCEDRCGLEDLLVCEFALRRLAGGCLHDACSVGVFACVCCKDFVDCALEVGPVQVRGGIWDGSSLRSCPHCRVELDLEGAMELDVEGAMELDV